ncbi:MAG TPA: DUF5777 family beta-barrel protein [Saprospiraceae bacterium]|nr:DUF5777 family beta-barrel protein [Saprospiraceae bacterium]
MKKYIKAELYFLVTLFICTVIAVSINAQTDAVDETTGTEKDLRPVKNTFEGVWLIDNQSVMVPIKGTLEFDIQHRFGVVKNGYDDLFGLYAPSNIRIGFSYTPVERLMLGFGFTKQNITWDLDAKYAILRQARQGGSPVSLTYFGNVAIDTREKENFVNSTDRYSYFNQLILARKVTENFSVQVAPSLSHYNAVEAYFNDEGDIQGKMNNDHLAVAVSGRYKITPAMSLIANYDQPITEHLTNNPNPNISFGLEISTSSHAFQIICGNYASIIPQRNNMFNRNNYEDGEFLIGFNITRLWNL